MTDAPGWVTLTDGERVVWAGHPSLVVAVGSIAAGVVLVVLGVAGVVAVPPPLNLGGAALAVLGVLVVSAGWVRRRSTAYVVTSEEVYAKSGLLSRNVRNVRLDRVQNTGFTQTFVQRLVGVGDVYVDTAGTGATEFVLAAVPDPGGVNGAITEQLDRLAGRV